MTDEVAALVLRDNYLQTQALSASPEPTAAELLDAPGPHDARPRTAGRLDRALEFLPDDEDARRPRARPAGPDPAGAGGAARLRQDDAVRRVALASDLPDDPRRSRIRLTLFPQPLRRDFRDAIERHRLRREIIATYVTNNMVNRGRPDLRDQMTEKTGAGPGRHRADLRRHPLARLPPGDLWTGGQN